MVLAVSPKKCSKFHYGWDYPCELPDGHEGPCKDWEDIEDSVGRSFRDAVDAARIKARNIAPEDEALFAEIRKLRKEHDLHTRHDPSCVFCCGAIT